MSRNCHLFRDQTYLLPQVKGMGSGSQRSSWEGARPTHGPSPLLASSANQHEPCKGQAVGWGWTEDPKVPLASELIGKGGWKQHRLCRLRLGVPTRPKALAAALPG